MEILEERMLCTLLIYVNVMYSANICDEFIDLLVSKVLVQIISEVKDVKYYGVNIDLTPDISHTYQMAIILCYVLWGGD